MSDSTFVYIIYIRTSPETLWNALTEPATVKNFWCSVNQESEWIVGSAWKMIIPDGRIADSGEIVEVVPSKRAVIRWRNEFVPELREEGYSLCKYELEPVGTSVKLTVTHTMDKPQSKFIAAVSNGWPHILSSLKSMLETGESLEETREWPEGK